MQRALKATFADNFTFYYIFPTLSLISLELMILFYFFITFSKRVLSCSVPIALVHL